MRQKGEKRRANSFASFGRKIFFIRLRLRRELFYQHVNLFTSQSCLDEVVESVSCLLRIPRVHLHIVRTTMAITYIYDPTLRRHFSRLPGWIIKLNVLK